MLSEEEILAGIDRTARSVTSFYGDEEFVVVSILKGSFVFASDLVRRIPNRIELSFVGVSSYRDGTESGPLEWTLFPTEDEFAGRRVLLVDDILDTGRTLSAVRSELLEQGARDVHSCVFLDKPARRAVEFRADFVGFEIDDVYVVGYGLDWAGRYRNLPYLATFSPEADPSRP